MRQGITIIDAINDPKLFAPWFHKRASWQNWFIFLAVLFALPLTPEQLAIYQQCTGRTTPPASPVLEAWLCCGRRSGKSFILALIAVYLACFHDWKPYLARGETGTIVIVAADRRQARTIFRYVRGLLNGVPMLKRMILRETAESFDLNNHVAIEIQAASFRSTRGYTLIAALCDEIAFWRSEDSANPDTEILAALRPAMATIPGARLLCASSPYSKRGALWTAFRKHFGKDDSAPLIWKAETRVMNPSVPQSIIDAAMEADPASAAAEYGAQFRSDVEGFVSREIVDACITEVGVRVRPPQRGTHYFGACDPSGGSADSFTACIGHMRYGAQTVTIDALVETKPPFSPEQVCKQYAELFKSYGVFTIYGDRYAGEWPREQFQKYGLNYQQSVAPKSEMYQTLLPILNSCRIELLDDPRLITQLVGLERRTARGGRDIIDHGPSGHDDLSNVIAIIASITLNRLGGYDINGLVNEDDGDEDIDGARAWRARRLSTYLYSGGMVKL